MSVGETPNAGQTPNVGKTPNVGGMPNVGEILGKTASWLAGRGFESARLEAELLMAHVLGTDRLSLYLDRDRPLVEEEIDAYRELVRRRAGGEPVAYLTGTREFYGLDFRLTSGVLVPRPETEMLVDRARELGAGRILDLCTGSGCVAITIAVRLPDAQVTATDSSGVALAVARENARTHGVDTRVRFLEGDLFACLGPAPDSDPDSDSDSATGSTPGGRFDLVVANPPYVPLGQATEVGRHEPALALYAGADGLDLVRRIVAEAPRWLESHGTLLVEIGEDQDSAALALASSGDYASAEVHRDLSGHPRVLEATRR